MHCAGSRSNWLLEAALYREWRTNRVIYGFIGVVMVLPWVYQALLLLQMQQMPPEYHYQMANNLIASYLMGNYSIIYFEMAMAGILGIAVFWNDRVRGHLNYALEGPLPRRQVLLAKVWYSIPTVVFANLAIIAALLLSAWGNQVPIAWGSMGLRAGFLIGMQIGLAATALAIGTAVGSVIFTAIGTLFVATSPLMLSSLVQRLTRPTPIVQPESSYVPNPPHWAVILTNGISNLSPFSSTYPTAGWSMLLFSAIALMWAGLVLWMALGWWARAPWERFGEPFFFPWLWNVYYGFLSLISALVGAALLHNISGWPFGMLAIPFWIIGWFVWRSITLWMGRWAWRWGPGIDG